MIFYNSRGIAMLESAAEQARIAGLSVGGETINAPEGNSSLSGEGGGDLLIGSSGDNRHWITDPKDVVVELADGGIDTQIGWTSIKLAPNVENLQVNGAFNYAVGNELGNLITVDNETHWIYGAGGDDVLVGGVASKVTYVIKAGEGSDVIYNWNGNSQVQLLDYGFATADAFRAVLSQSGADVVARLDNDETLTFRNTMLDGIADRQLLLQLDTTKLGALTFSDEFETLQIYDHSLQTGQWRADFGGNLRDPWAFTLPSNGERQVYTKPGFYGQGESDLDLDPFSISGGVLTITAERIPEEQRDAAWGREYSSGMLNTLGMFEQKYGYFEIRAEMPTAEGAWPAFWMMPSPYVAQVEADIFEGLALTPNVDYRRAWGGGDNLYDNAYKVDASGFHTYGMLWTPETVTFYYDSVAVLQAPTPLNWVHPMGMIVNMAVGGWGGEPNSLKFPTEMKVDYVRAYALSDGGTVIERGLPEPPAATLRADGGPTSGQVNAPVVFDADGRPVTTAGIAVYDARPTELPPGKTFVIWEDAGAVFGAVSDGTSLGQSTILMAGDSSTFTGRGTWLTDGKVVLGYMMPDVPGQAAWAMVFDPAKLTFTRHELGPATGDLDFVATANGGFAASWDSPGGTVVARGYDAFAYDGEGWYGPARTLSGDLTGVTATGELIATDAGGVQQLYDLVNPPKAVLAAVSVGPMAGVTHPEGDTGSTLYTFTVIRDWDQSERSTVGWTVRGQGANPADALDFQGGVMPSGQLVFEPGETTGYIQIWVAGDTLREANEEFLITLVDPVATKLGQPTATGFITDDDAEGAPPPAQTRLDFSTTTVSQTEGASGVTTAYAYTVVRTGSTSESTTVSWSVSGSGANPATAADFQNGALPTGTLTFAAGETSRTLVFSVSGDGAVEADEAFTVTLSAPSGAALGAAHTAAGVIRNDDASTTAGSGGQVIQSDSYGDSLAGGAGHDTLIAGQGPDVLTGGGGADSFVYRDVVWNPGRVTDFTLGQDKLDFSQLFQKYGYAGSDPVADHYVMIGANSAGDATISFDHDGAASGNLWPSTMMTLSGVSATGLTWAQLTNPAPPPAPAPPPTGEPGEVINSPGYGSTLTGGPGADTLNAGQGPDVLIGGGGGDSFAYAALPWNAGRVDDFVVGVDRLDLSRIFASSGYTGSDPIADGRMRLDSDGAGGTQVYFDHDAAGSGDWPFLVTTLSGVSPVGLTWAQLSGGAGAPAPLPSPQVGLTTTSLSLAEGDAGSTAFTYTVARTGPTTGETTVNWSVSGSGSSPATGADFTGGALPAGTLVFAAGETTKTFAVQVAGDTLAESSEGFTVTLSGATGAALGAATATGRINDDDAAAAGQVITSSGPGDTLVGGAGADTLNASRGSDQLTGGAGDDLLVWKLEPWSPATVTDFTVGADRIDLSSLFSSAGYAGADPVADKYVLFIDNGQGGTKMLFDRDGAAPEQAWGNYIIDLQGVPTAGLTWGMLTGAASPPPPPPPLATGAPTLVVFAGQSNIGGAFMESSDVSSAWQADPLTLIWDIAAKEWVQMEPGVNTGYGSQPDTWGPEVQFAIDFRAANPGDVLHIVKYAEGGTGLALNAGAYVSDWSPDSANELFDRTTAIINEASAAAGGLRPAAVFFGQGEEDANTEAAANAYAANLPAFLSAVRAEWMGDDQGMVVIARIGQTSTYADLVRAAQLQTDVADTDTFSFDTADYPLQPDFLHYTADGYDMAGAAYFRLFSQAPTDAEGVVVDSQGYGSTLSGGAGADTLNAGQGPDVLTGGGGADHFVLAHAPWNAGRITDFTPGTDKIDLRGLLDEAGYLGSDAIADGYILLEAVDGGTRVIFDLDGPSSSGQWPVTVTTLSGVAPGSIAPSGWIFQ